MKTPSDVYNNMQLILAHIEDIKTVRAITKPRVEAKKFFGKKPHEVFKETQKMFITIKDIASFIGAIEVEIPKEPDKITPKDLFNSTRKIVQYLQAIKRRIGAENLEAYKKASQRISPSHVYAEAVRINAELELLRSKFLAKNT
jgi:hemerythrin-like domain-containing protein